MYVLIIFFIVSSTFLKDCPFVIKVRLSSDGNKLVIPEICGEHNYSLSKVSTVQIIQ